MALGLNLQKDMTLKMSKILKTSILTGYDSYDIVELEPNLLRLKTMSVDEDGCYWSLVGYIYNDIKMWVDVKISND